MVWLAAMDLVCLLAASLSALSLRIGPDEIPQYVFEHLDGWLIYFSGVLLANYLAGSYRIQYTYSRFNLVVTWLFSMIFAFLILSLTTYAWFRIVLGRGVLVLSMTVYSALVLSIKLLLYRRIFRSRNLECETVLVGVGPFAGRLVEVLDNPSVLPAHRVVACIRVAGMPGQTDAVHGAVLGVPSQEVPVEELLDVVRRYRPRLVVLGVDPAYAVDLFPVLKRLRFEGVEVMMPMQVMEIYSGCSPLELLSEESLMSATMETGFPVVRGTKRVFDIVFASLGLVVCAPVMALIAVIQKGAYPAAPVFYTQWRAGQFGKPFRIAKFRTMVPGAENATGPVWAAANDPRITRLGAVLRKYRFDELPQLLNILKGDMSVVGPRPERPEIVVQLEKDIPFYSERTNILPGLTGWAQVRYPYGSDLNDARRKLEFDLYYIKHLSLRLDLQIILSTLRIVSFGKERAV
jgi:exopolysaccharide biosynthesis polyprenyl glycosylphosphotransferase